MRVSRAPFSRRHNFGLALLSEGVAPALRIAARACSRGSSTDPSTWRRGLIVGHGHVGDVLYRSCSLEQLKAGLPQCSWDYLTTPSSATVLKDNPALESVLPLAPENDSPLIERDAFRRLRTMKHDVVLCTNTVRHLPELVLAAALGARNRVGFGDKGYSGLLTLPVSMNYPQPFPGYFRTLVGAVVEASPDWPLQPRVFPRPAHRRQAELCLGGLDLDPSLPTLACTATTRQSAGEWPPSFFSDVLTRVMNEQPANVVFFGAARDEATLRAIAQAVPSPSRIVAGGLDWLAFAETLRMCDALLAMDAGPRHLANAVGTPVAFARNLSFLRVEAGAYCPNEIDLAPSSAELAGAGEISALVKSVSVRDAGDRVLRLLRRARA